MLEVAEGCMLPPPIRAVMVAHGGVVEEGQSPCFSIALVGEELAEYSEPWMLTGPFFLQMCCCYLY
jgi:hypothetical protein